MYDKAFRRGERRGGRNACEAPAGAEHPEYIVEKGDCRGVRVSCGVWRWRWRWRWRWSVGRS